MFDELWVKKIDGSTEKVNQRDNLISTKTHFLNLKDRKTVNWHNGSPNGEIPGGSTTTKLATSTGWRGGRWGSHPPGATEPGWRRGSRGRRWGWPTSKS